MFSHVGWKEGVVAAAVLFHTGEAHNEIPAEDHVVAVGVVFHDMVEEGLGVEPTNSVVVSQGGVVTRVFRCQGLELGAAEVLTHGTTERAVYWEDLVHGYVSRFKKES